MKMKILLMTFLTGLVVNVNAAEKAPETVPNVDLDKYVGKWYEVASIPQFFQKQCVSNTTAEYSLAEKGLIKVINSCETESGERSTVEGRAKIVDTVSNAKLKVTFVKFIKWIFAIGGDYWVLDVGQDYSYALVGEASRKYAWILSRRPDVSVEFLISMEKKFAEQGYDTCAILTSVQKDGISERIPLCQIAGNSK